MFDLYPDEARLIGTTISVAMTGLDEGRGIAWMRGQVLQIVEPSVLRRAADQHARRLGVSPPPEDKAQWRAVVDGRRCRAEGPETSPAASAPTNVISQPKDP